MLEHRLQNSRIFFQRVRSSNESERSEASRKVISQLKKRLGGDEVLVARRYIYQSFGMKGHIQPSEGIFEITDP